MEVASPLSTAEAHPIPGYELLEPVGEGGMGQVFRALQQSPPRTVAIKFLHPSVNDQVPLLSFRRESRLMASLTHPHVVAVYEYGQVQGQQYLVMEYVAGRTLRSRMHPGQPWRAENAALVLEAIAQALSYIHREGILHLDLKPENVLCTEEGEVKITDFGLALPEVDARTLSELGLAQGTLDYCSPEQRYGLPLDQRSDVFSLGTVAYEMLSGRLPGRIYSPITRPPSPWSARVDKVLRRGLARDPSERHASVDDFRLEIAAALNVPPSSPSP